jgi:thioredoxin:protein disulfide reductase
VTNTRTLCVSLPGWLLALCLCAVAANATAQLRRPRAEVTPLAETPAVHAGRPIKLAVRVSLPEGLHTQSNKPRDPLLIPTVLTVDTPAGVAVTELVFPPSTDLEQIGQDQPLAVFEHEFLIGVVLELSPETPSGALAIPAHLRYQACDANLCYPPATADFEWTLDVAGASTATGAAADPAFAGIPFGRGERPVDAQPPSGESGRIAAPPRAAGDGNRPTGDGLAELANFDLLATTGGYLGTDEFLTFIRNAEMGVRERGLFEGRGPLAILLIVFLGGLALNLTPCVLPMIPINLAIIGAGAQAGTRSRGFLLGSAYGAAMAVVYGVLGLIVILTAGTFGTINASAWFNLGIALLFVVLGLAMFDVLLIDFSRYSTRFNLDGAGRGSFAVAFGMGAVAALLAGACVAPVVIQVVLFSSNLYATGTTLALALPFCLGIGMAVPWPIAGAGLASLPRPGPWMIRVKQAFGVMIIATAIYYGYVAYGLFANRWVDPAAVSASVEAQLKDGWTPSLAAGLASAAAQQKPVLIDIWATWCKNCLTMDKTTLADANVKAALANYVKIKFQAEQPDDPPARDVMQRFGAVGLPTYVILRPQQRAAER